MFFYILAISVTFLSAAESLTQTVTNLAAEYATIEPDNTPSEITICRTKSLLSHFHKSYAPAIMTDVAYLDLGKLSDDQFVRFQSIVTRLIHPLENPSPLMMQIIKWQRLLSTGLTNFDEFLGKLDAIKPKHMTDKKSIVDALTDYMNVSKTWKTHLFEGGITIFFKGVQLILNPLPISGKQIRISSTQKRAFFKTAVTEITTVITTALTQCQRQLTE